MSSSSSDKPIIAILGAGITGLQTALSILTSSSSSLLPKSRVIILAALLPGDEDITYTSPWAGAHWRSHAHATPEEAEIRDWDAATYNEWRRLIDTASSTTAAGITISNGNDGIDNMQQQEEVERQVGLGIRQSIMFWSTHTDETLGGSSGAGEGLWWRHLVSGFRVLSAKELAAASHASRTVTSANGEQELMISKSKSIEKDIKNGGSGLETDIVFGVSYDTVCVNVPRYLSYLTERIMTLGGEIIRARVNAVAADIKAPDGHLGGVESVVEEVKSLVNAHITTSKNQTTSSIAPDNETQNLKTLILATGLLSQNFLPKPEADNLYPVRGQTVLVRGEAPRAVTKLFPGGEIAYVIPRPGSGTTILGGCKEVGSWVAEEDKETTAQILSRARALVPELLRGGADAGEGDGEFEVLGVQVGRRPGRVGGPRVEAEKETVGGVRVIYAYGHEGAGYQNSVGSAEKVVSLLAGDI